MSPYRGYSEALPSRTCGGDKRDRTADPLLAKQVLSQLSYTPISLRAEPLLNNDSKVPLTLDV